MKYYKVISKDNKAKEGGDFNYNPYLPKGKIKGKWTPKQKTKLCYSGYHVTPYWNMWVSDKTNNVYEVEVKGLVKDDSVGVVDKFVCSQIRFIKKIDLLFDEKNNTGNRNTGNRNTGIRNTGYCNTGDRNTGNWNTGDRNTGDRNTGIRNTGDRNTGDRNTGDRNTGNWNTACKHVGCFNTEKPKYIELFNKPITFDEYEKIVFPRWLFFELKKDYKESFKEAFKEASVQGVRATVELPNFDYKVFEEISGITKRMICNKIGGIKNE